MICESVCVHRQTGISNIAPACETKKVRILSFLSAATLQNVVKRKQTIGNQTNRLAFSICAGLYRKVRLRLIVMGRAQMKRPMLNKTYALLMQNQSIADLNAPIVCMAEQGSGN